MDRITIFERDISNIPAEDIGTNIVYVPGYAVMGPVNTPTLCRNLNEFQSTFGFAPYLFENGQTFESIDGFEGKQTGNFANTGDREKSYIYACELANKGLPILYERVMTEEKETIFTFESKLYDSTKSKTLTEDIEIEDDESYILKGSVIKSGSIINGVELPTDTTIDTKTLLAENDEIKTDSEIKVGSVINGKTIITDNYLTIKVKNPGLYGNSISYTLINTNKDNYRLELTQYDTYIDSTEYKENNEDKIGKNRKYLETPITTSVNFSLNYNDPLYFENLTNIPLIEFEGITTEELNGTISKLLEVKDAKFINKNKEFSDTEEYEVNDVVIYKNVLWKCISAVTTAGEWNSSNWERVYEFEIKDIYKLMSGEFEGEGEDSVSKVYNKNTETYNEESLFTKLVDRGEYDFKFITSGAYPILDFSSVSYKKLNEQTNEYDKKFKYTNFITSAMLWTAGKRGDSIAFVDYLNEYMGLSEKGYKTPIELKEHLNNIFNPEKWETTEGTYIVKLSNNREETTPKYSNILLPWSIYDSVILKNQNILPASFGYLNSLAVSVKTNPNWYPVAGVTRGIVPNLRQLCTPITNAQAEALQQIDGISINPITLIKPYGYTIWGNRTLNYNEDVLIASSLLHIRNLVCDVKKVVYIAAKKFMFEPISEILWLNFKSEIEPLLDKMKSGNGLTKYEILRKSTTEKATICAIIRLWAVDAVEKFDVTIELSDSYVNIE